MAIYICVPEQQNIPLYQNCNLCLCTRMAIYICVPEQQNIPLYQNCNLCLCTRMQFIFVCQNSKIYLCTRTAICVGVPEQQLIVACQKSNICMCTRTATYVCVKSRESAFHRSGSTDKSLFLSCYWLGLTMKHMVSYELLSFTTVPQEWIWHWTLVELTRTSTVYQVIKI